MHDRINLVFQLHFVWQSVVSRRGQHQTKVVLPTAKTVSHCLVRIWHNSAVSGQCSSTVLQKAINLNDNNIQEAVDGIQELCGDSLIVKDLLE